MIFMDFSISMVSGATVTLAAGFILFSFCKQDNGKSPGKKYLRKLEKQLPNFLDLVSSNLAVGNSLQQSIETAAKKDQITLGPFFETILLRVRSGMTLDLSLEQEARDMRSGSLTLALLSMASSYRSGSNMIESLSLLATLCRERELLRKKILARTAQSRTQGYVLIFVPLLFMLLLYFVSPHNMIPVLGTSTGRVLLGTAATLQCLGAIVIRAMLKQEIL